MKRITRDQLLTPEEVAKYKQVREQVAAELPDLVARHHERMASLDELQTVLMDLKAAREAKGLSLADLTALTGMDRSALSKLETTPARESNGGNPRPLCRSCWQAASRRPGGCAEGVIGSNGVALSAQKRPPCLRHCGLADSPWRAAAPQCVVCDCTNILIAYRTSQRLCGTTSLRRCLSTRLPKVG
jgi:hypothetical protein